MTWSENCAVLLTTAGFCNPTPRIGLFVRSFVRPSDTKKSRIRGTCIKVQDQGYKHHSYLHRTYMHQDRGSYIYASGSRVIYIYASYMHASGSRVIYICIMDTCIYASGSRIKIIYISIIISVKDHRYMHRTYKHHTNIPQGQGSKIYASHTLASRITDICIIHICIRPIYVRVKNQRYMHHI